MKRKVNKVGQNTLTVSLPSKWVKKLNIKPGDELELAEDKDNLIIGGKIREHKKAITINLKSSYPKYIRALMRNLYIHGYEIIKIIYNNEKDYVSISDALNGLVGFEIIKESKDECIIESISDIKYDQYLLFLNKQFQIISTMQNLLLDAMTNQPNDVDFAIISSLSKKSSKYACICRRVLTRNNLMNDDEPLTIFFVINLIHMVARNYANCYKYIKENKIKTTKGNLDYLKESINLFNELYELYLKKKKGSLDITEKRQELLSITLKELFNKKAEPMVLHYLAEIVRFIGTCAPKISLMNDFLKSNISNEIEA